LRGSIDNPQRKSCTRQDTELRKQTERRAQKSKDKKKKVACIKDTKNEKSTTK
jgi:hypothetical protein